MAKTLEQKAFVLSQVFSFPVLIIRGKAYVGGKVIDNTGGHLADFLATNPVTRNAVIIEIKTPETELLGSNYRKDVYSASEESTKSFSMFSIRTAWSWPDTPGDS